MRHVQTLIRRDPWDVEPFLRRMNMTSPGLRRVRDIAITERGNATAFHPRNSPGTFAYHHGIWALRDQFVGEHYKAECPGGVEAIVAADLSVRISFANVDRCCDVSHSPAPISHKGAGVERLCEANLFGDALPTYTKQNAAMGIPLYYVMVDLDGRIELSLPTIVGKTFGPCVERNFISLGGDDEGGGTRVSLPNEEGPVDVAPTITRKAA